MRISGGHLSSSPPPPPGGGYGSVHFKIDLRFVLCERGTPPTNTAYKHHLQTPPTNTAYKHHLQTPPTNTTYKHGRESHLTCGAADECGSTADLPAVELRAAVAAGHAVVAPRAGHQVRVPADCTPRVPLPARCRDAPSLRRRTLTCTKQRSINIMDKPSLRM